MSKVIKTLRKTITMFPGTVMLSCTLFHGPLSAQQESGNERDTTRDPKSGVYPLPILFYTPETGFAGGAAVLYLYRNSQSDRASSLTADIIYTRKKQFVSELSGDQYFQAGRYRLVTYFSWQKYPNKFFGIGNNTPDSSEEAYTPKTLYLRAALYRNLSSHVNVGPMVSYASVSSNETEPGGLLADGHIAGSQGGRSVGLGFVANWDSRDNTFAAQSGSFCQITTVLYRHAFGSDFSYDDIQVDARTFFGTFAGHVVAVQSAGEFINGSAPFQRLAKFGGSNLMRGYLEGRFRDKNAVLVQAEYRVPVWWRFGLVGFAGAAEVADRITRFALNGLWFAGGIGFRFAFNPEERINLRCDYGVGSNSSGVYINITEAF
jgi:outer membrane protein assembly factor BamA